MKYYLLRGINGIIIHYDFYKAQLCQRYIHKSVIKKYEVFEDAEAAALEHLAEIVPGYITLPEHIELNDMITVAKLDRAYKGRQE